MALGSGTSVCLVDLGYQVIDFTKDKSIIEDLKKGKSPVFEQDLDKLFKKNLDNQHLQFITDIEKSRETLAPTGLYL